MRFHQQSGIWPSWWDLTNKGRLAYMKEFYLNFIAMQWDWTLGVLWNITFSLMVFEFQYNSKWTFYKKNSWIQFVLVCYIPTITKYLNSKIAIWERQYCKQWQLHSRNEITVVTYLKWEITSLIVGVMHLITISLSKMAKMLHKHRILT